MEDHCFQIKQGTVIVCQQFSFCMCVTTYWSYAFDKEIKFTSDKIYHYKENIGKIVLLKKEVVNWELMSV